MKMGKHSKHGSPKKELSTIKLEEFVVNLADLGEPHYLKVSLVLEIEGDAKHKTEEGGGEDPKVRDAVIRVLSSKRFSQLLTETGKEKLKAGLRKALDPVMKPGKVANIYFTSFAMQ